MLRLKATILIFGMVILASLSYAQAAGSFGSSVATADDLFAPLENPALIGTGNQKGIGWIHAYEDTGFNERYWFVANMEGLSYVYGNDYGISTHNFAIGNEFFIPNKFRNFYFGSSYKWTNDKTNEGSFRSGIAYRPIDALSLGMTFDNPYKSAPSYRFGGAIRPLAFVPGVASYRAEFSVDMDYAKNTDREYAMIKPTVGVNTQLVDGLKLGALYNMETETPMFSFSLSSKKNEMGTRVSSKDDNTSGFAYSFMSEDSFKPIFGIAPKQWYGMKLKGSLVTYRSPKYKIGPFSLFDAGTRSIEDLIKEVNRAKSDPETHGILLKNPSFSASFSLMEELIAALGEYRASGKKIAVYYDNIGNGGYIFASAVADKIYLNPNGGIDLRGFSINSPYFKELLDALGIEVMNFRSHQFKTAYNMFSETEMTEAEREVYSDLLDTIYNRAIAMIEAGRGNRIKKSAAELIDGGPYWLSEQAKELGMVDNVIYLDQLEEHLQRDFGFKKSIGKLEKYRSYAWAKPIAKQVAVIYAQGSIVGGKGEPGNVIAQETMVEQIRNARKNKNYKGIILRVDSGGGSAFASDVILRELELAKTENKMPIVVSMSGAAASGGYYIACNADKIVANRTTITGSIGVVGIQFQGEKLFKKIKVNWSNVKKGENADFGSMYRKWNESEKEMVSLMIEDIYNDFIARVSQGRKMSTDDVHKIAQGRVWTGEQAHKIGLVDVLGGMDEAVKQMKDLAKIKGKIQLVDATSAKKGIPIEMKNDPLGLILPNGILRKVGLEYKKVYDMWTEFDQERVLMLSPVTTPSLDK